METTKQKINHNNFKPINITFNDGSELWLEKTDNMIPHGFEKYAGEKLTHYATVYDYRIFYIKKGILPITDTYENTNCDIHYAKDRIILYLIDKNDIETIQDILDIFNLIDKTSERDIYFNINQKTKEELNLTQLNAITLKPENITQITQK